MCFSQLHVGPHTKNLLPLISTKKLINKQQRHMLQRWKKSEQYIPLFIHFPCPSRVGNFSLDMLFLKVQPLTPLLFLFPLFVSLHYSHLFTPITEFTFISQCLGIFPTVSQLASSGAYLPPCINSVEHTASSPKRTWFPTIKIVFFISLEEC